MKLDLSNVLDVDCFVTILSHAVLLPELALMACCVAVGWLWCWSRQDA